MFKKFFVAFLLMLFVSAVPVSAMEVISEEMLLKPEDVVLDEDGSDNRLVFDGTIQQKDFNAGGKKYYTQAKYECKEGYDIFAVYVLAGGEYSSRVFFVRDDLYGEYLRYDYDLMSAETFLSDWEVKESNGTTLYVPVAKMRDGKNIAQKDIDGTPLDESKIPVIRAEDVASVGYAWQDLSEIPFLKNGGEYVYASTAVQDMDPGQVVTPTPTPTPTSTPEEDNIKVVNGTVGSTAYRIEYTASVKYDGRAHVWSQKRLTTKALKKKVNDVSVNIYRNGVLLASGDYNVKFKNNTKISGTNGKTPFFRIVLKGKALKQEGAALKKAKFAFDIVE